MRREFKKRDWILFNQPAQSPITNVHDACVFPMLSKAVSREQAVTFGSRLLKGEQLNQTVMKVWQDKKNLHAIARAFAAHHQIVNSIIKHKGDNNFLTEKGGLTFGIRRMYVRNEEGDGVVPVTLAPEDVQETAQDRLISESGRRGLKYDTPNVKDLKKARLTEEMEEILMEYMDHEMMSAQLHRVWQRINFERDPNSKH